MLDGLCGFREVFCGLVVGDGKGMKQKPGEQSTCSEGLIYPRSDPDRGFETAFGTSRRPPTGPTVAL